MENEEEGADTDVLVVLGELDLVSEQGGFPLLGQLQDFLLVFTQVAVFQRKQWRVGLLTPEIRGLDHVFLSRGRPATIRKKEEKEGDVRGRTRADKGRKSQEMTR